MIVIIQFDTFTYVQNLTQYRQAGQCFMLDGGFDEFSSLEDDWLMVCA